MKYIFIVAISLSLFACQTTKEVSQLAEVEQTAADEKISGVVRAMYKGCSPLIETTIDGELVKLYPVNLSEKFQVDGLKIKFNYLPSRAQQPESCTLITRVVSVENVEVVK